MLIFMHPYFQHDSSRVKVKYYCPDPWLRHRTDVGKLKAHSSILGKFVCVHDEDVFTHLVEQIQKVVQTQASLS